MSILYSVFKRLDILAYIWAKCCGLCQADFLKNCRLFCYNQFLISKLDRHSSSKIMGSFFSAAEKRPQESSKIESLLPKTNIPDYDTFFSEISLQLARADEIRFKVHDFWTKALDLTGVWVLNIPLDSPNLYKIMIEIFLWTISAEAGGNMTKYNIKKNPEHATAIGLELTQLSADSQKIYFCLSELAETLTGQFPVIQEIYNQLKSCQEEVLEKVKNAKARAKEVGLSVEDSAKALITVGENAKIVETGILKIKKLLDMMSEVNSLIKTYSNEIGLMVLKAREVGEQADKAQIYQPVEIVENYHYLPKLTAEEINKRKKLTKRRDNPRYYCC